MDFPDAYIDVDGSPVQINQVKKSPGQQYTLKIKASPGTRLGLMSVDQSVYLLRDDNRLTKERVSTFQRPISPILNVTLKILKTYIFDGNVKTIVQFCQQLSTIVQKLVLVLVGRGWLQWRWIATCTTGFSSSSVYYFGEIF